MMAFDLAALAALFAFAINIWTLALWRRETNTLRATLTLMTAELANLRASSHRRDPRTGRLLPLGK